MEERLTTAGVAEKDGRFFVARRLPGGPLSEKWEFVGGKNRYGETIEDTLMREWLEELEVKVEVGEYLLETEFINRGTHYTLKVHRILAMEGEPRLHYHSEFRWVDKETLSSLEFGESDTVIKNFVLRNL